MSVKIRELTERERELGAIITAYNEVTEQLKGSHDRLREEVHHLREELARKNAELRRRERLAALGEMAAGVAHEIRNPLGGIQLFSSLLVKDLSDRPAQLAMVRKISKCVGALEQIVADILEFGRPSVPQPAPVDLVAVVCECVELASSHAKRAAVELEVSPETAHLEMVVDGALLQRALLNLVVNGIEAAASVKDRPRAVCVRIEAAGGPDGQVVIRVEDNGPGVAPELLDRVFNPFFTTKDGGTGLGLAIVHQVAEALGGSVGVSNRADGGGAIFTLRIPVRPESRPDVEGERRRRMPPGGSMVMKDRTLGPSREEVV